ncbi:hypothetical protein LOTGIDRAFT_115552 [Lottia gigantea]|uniref:RING-type domain-containing protein n=1 Tax=Lottia gigantea TaxID=225164 RepID=V4ATH2_LOTGI|nr:hypothetical protein LOTGIDRAFT_115552 [Lottia gigantea]ESO97036.1 hypothetical protein LOTGIDRAFT_115552 [Lottia gigantea]
MSKDLILFCFFQSCPVCLEDFKSNEKLAICPCKHGFHQKCLCQWLHRKNTCPLCKAKVQPLLGERTGLMPIAVTTL